MKKFIFCISLVLTGLMTACIDKNEAVDADSKPSWLGGSIYQELKNPQYLTGTFSTYLRLIDDLGYGETLNRTGSKTVFPANDEAFARFFKSNDWGVSNYDQLTNAQKKMLLYGSMLDNALLVGMLSNVSNTSSNSVTPGMAMKHETSLTAIDTLQHITNSDLLPKNNKYWDKFRNNTNLYIVSDSTAPMMVHFTREHMLNNGIKVTGDRDLDNDFAILTGTLYSDSVSAYIFNDAVIKKDVTCQNGYIHQMRDVIVPPGNMAQVLRNDPETSYFSRMLDYFCAPFESPGITNTYNATALLNGLPTIDMVYEMRYLNNDANHRQTYDPDGNMVSSSHLLPFDPGWNKYSPQQKSGGVDYTIADVAALFVPTDAAVKAFFTQGGDGAYLIDLYGKYQGAQNTEANLAENLDSLHSKRPEILTSFLNNLMKPKFTATVPSKFETLTNDANEYMGVTTAKLDRNAKGNYDIQVANNGVIYKMTELIAPDEYQCVMAPSSVYPDMQIFNWAIKEPDPQQKLNLDFKYYLLSMGTKFAFFIPDDAAFEKYYIDPVYLGRSQPRALKFYWYTSDTKTTVRCKAYQYDPKTNTIGNVMNNGANVAFEQWKSLLIDILNYHTVVLGDNDVFGENKYYKTKHGGEIMITGNSEGAKIMSGQQIDNGVTPATITKVYPEKNGTAFRIDHVIESPRNSVSKTLNTYSQFSEFAYFCGQFSNGELLKWAGISDVANDFGISPQDGYIIFTSDRGSGSAKVGASCLDENVKMFNTYNYTLFAPNNTAMQQAYKPKSQGGLGIPSWTQVQDLHDQYPDETDESAAAVKAREDAKAMIDQMRQFARYHFMSTSVYADKKIETGRYNSLSTDEKGLALELNVSGSNNQLIVTDGAGTSHTINANNTSTLCNLMAREYWFDAPRTQATSIYTSSFCVVHELSEPLDPGAGN